jgi:ADP-ribosyl-[dinitrogen reductase] hydrolase
MNNLAYYFYRFGDYYGLGNEGIARKHIRDRKFMRFISDDTEHMYLTIDALNRSDSPQTFSVLLRHNLRSWLATLPPGVGFATLKACLRMWLTKNSGSYSAGNGPLMRVLPIVDRIPLEQQQEYLRISTTLTHTDPKALTAVIAYCNLLNCIKTQPNNTASLLKTYLTLSDEPEWIRLVTALETQIKLDHTLETLLSSVSCEQGISGYCYHTIIGITAIMLYGINHNFKGSNYFEATLHAGGDTDTTCALMGPIVAQLDPAFKIPYQSWNFPNSTKLLSKLLDGKPLPLGYFGSCLVRNLLTYPFYLGYGLIRRFI